VTRRGALGKKPLHTPARVRLGVTREVVIARAESSTHFLLGLPVRKKLLMSAFLTAIIISGLILVNTVHIGTVHASTNVSGIISSDTTWTQIGSPYNLTGNVLINNGVTLTIQLGVTVNLNSYYITVNGTLQAIGNSSNPITFSGGQIIFTQYSANWTESTGTGCIMQNATISSAITLGYSTKINYDTVYGAIADSSSMSSTTGVQSIISNSTILGGIQVYGNETISNNVILNQGISPWGTATVSDNIISGCTAGITTYDYPILIGNLIVNNTIGVEINNFGSPQCPIIQNNTISNNTNGIGFPQYWSGTPFSPSIFYNNIYANTNYNIVSAVPNNINATLNWWGTTDQQAINQTIYDYYDNFNVGIVTHNPFLTAPNTEAPAYIFASAGAGGSITPSGIIRLNYGDNQNFTITAYGGYAIANVSVNGTSVGAVNSYTVQNIQGATSISVTFTLAVGPTQVSGVISSDTIWYMTGSPYNLTGNLLVNNGVTLTIEPGVTVNLNNFYILVNGTLSSRGTTSNSITINGGNYIAFTPFSSNWNEQTTTGSIIENTTLNAIQLSIYASPKINDDIFQNSYIQVINVWQPFPMVYIPSNNASSIISNNNILGGISIENMWGNGGSPDTACPQISNNTITAVTKYSGTGISTFYSTGLVSNNTISGFGQGLYLYSDAGTLIEENLIIDNTNGVVTDIHQGSTNPIIENNTVSNNLNGFYLTRSFPAATNAVIVNNNIYGNINHNIRLGIPDTINVTYNWWGTNDTQAINQTIYDFKNDFNLGTVNFVPFLNEPNPAAPVAPPAIPEFPSSLILPLLIVATMLIAIFSKRKQFNKTRL
jgi:parallel beta-helix repeat protein